MLNKKNVSRLAQPDKLVKLITDWCKNKQTKETKNRDFRNKFTQI